MAGEAVCLRAVWATGGVADFAAAFCLLAGGDAGFFAISFGCSGGAALVAGFVFVAVGAFVGLATCGVGLAAALRWLAAGGDGDGLAVTLRWLAAGGDGDGLAAATLCGDGVGLASAGLCGGGVGLASAGLRWLAAGGNGDGFLATTLGWVAGGCFRWVAVGGTAAFPLVGGGVWLACDCGLGVVECPVCTKIAIKATNKANNRKPLCDDAPILAISYSEYILELLIK
ncbi:hypothetical protein ABFX02_12G121300 [Erythranthe guttata]